MREREVEWQGTGAMDWKPRNEREVRIVEHLNSLGIGSGSDKHNFGSGLGWIGSGQRDARAQFKNYMDFIMRSKA